MKGAGRIFEGQEVKFNKFFNKRKSWEERLSEAKQKVKTILKRSDAEAIKNIAKDLLEKYSLSALENLTEEALKKECGQYCEPEELLAVCFYLEEKRQAEEDKKFEKYN